jgi:ABC-2 type transport system permease protein
MLARIALFELRYQLRRPIALISFAVFALLTFGLVATAGLEPDGIPLNAPGRIAFYFCMFGLFGMFLSIATIADVSLRDDQSRMDAILRAQPVSNSVHYGARFAGAFAVACFCFLGVAFGYAAGVSMPWVSAKAAGAFRPEAYALAFLIMSLPTLFATGALFFTIATLTRRLMATYMGAVVILILVVGGSVLMGHPTYRTYAALFDPFGIFAFIVDTERWSGVERLTHPIPLDGLLLWNRLLWIGIGAVLMVLSFTLFSTRERRPRARVDAPATARSMVMINRPVIAAGAVGAWAQLALRTRHETRSILRSWTFLILLILGLLLAVGILSVLSLIDTIPDPSSTQVVVNAVAGAFTLITVLVPIAYGGELIWRDRNAKIAQIIDATAAPNVVFLLSKIIAVAVVILALLAVAMATGVTFQLYKGAESIDVGYYLIKLSLFVGLPALMYGVLAIFIQTVVNRKFVSLLLMLALLGIIGYADEVGITNKLLLPFSIPYRGYANLLPSLLYAGYWTSIALLIGLASHLLWVRGAGSLWTRIKCVRITPAAAVIAVLALAGTAATAGYIIWEPSTIASKVSATSAFLGHSMPGVNA